MSNNPHTDPPGLGPKIDYVDHKQQLAELVGMFPGLKVEDMPDSEGLGVERIQGTAHNGTHLDAPWHYASTMDGGEPAMTIDEMPLEWCFQPGVKLDFRHFEDGYLVQPQDIDAELKRIGHTLKPLDIVVVNTGAGAHYGQPGYIDKGCGFGRAATLHLLDQGVRIVGTDAWSWDAPMSFTAQALRSDRRREPDLRGPQGRARARLRADREARQSGATAGDRVLDFVFSL